MKIYVFLYVGRLCTSVMNVGSTLAQHLRRWPNIDPTPDPLLVLAAHTDVMNSQHLFHPTD